MKKIFFLITLLVCHYLPARSPLRTNTTPIPFITTQWDSGGDQRTFTLHSEHLNEYSLFGTFDKNFFLARQLPQEEIPYRTTPEKSIKGSELSELIATLVNDINHHKKPAKNVLIIRDSNFNYRKKCGLLVIKFHEHPFIIKLFMETPHSFVDPHAKGFAPICFFYMAGGINRHLTGFTRIKNREQVQKKLAHNPTWQSRIILPRKWYWYPQNQPWIRLYGKHIANTPLTTTFPGTYAVIADEIVADKHQTLNIKKDRTEIMQLCNDLAFAIDPHVDNFIVDAHTNKLAIIDTEHFPTVIGLKEPINFSSYRQWYMYLTQRGTKAVLLGNKEERKTKHKERSLLELK